MFRFEMEECDFISHVLGVLMEECDFNSHVLGVIIEECDFNKSCARGYNRGV